MKNVKSNDGIINITGELGSPSYIVNPDSIDFYDEIEDGIKSTVKSILDAGFETISSCEGHYDKTYQLRTVTLILKKTEIIFWRYMISELNILNGYNFPIEYHILKQNNEVFVDFMIIIGSVYNMRETILKQNDLEKAIFSIRSKYYNKKKLEFKDFSSKTSHINEFNG